MDGDIRALERACLTEQEDGVALEAFARASARRGDAGLEDYRKALEERGFFSELARYFWRLESLRATSSRGHPPAEGVGLEVGDLLEWSSNMGQVRVRRRIVEMSARGGRLIVVVVALVKKRASDRVGRRCSLGDTDRGNRGAKWMGELVAPIDPRARRVLLASDRKPDFGTTVATLLRATWCAGWSQAETEALLTDWITRFYGYERLAFWGEVHALTGWAHTREKGLERLTSPRRVPELPGEGLVPSSSANLTLFGSRWAPGGDP